MAVDWNYLISSMETYHLSAFWDGEDCSGHVTKAWTKWGESNYNSCLYWTLFAVDDLQYTIHDITLRFLWGENGFSMMVPAAFRYLKSAVDSLGGGLTMDAILSTMLSANPEQVNYFVGLVDAYRQSIWNRPFDKDFYSALAKGFMIWP